MGSDTVCAVSGARYMQQPATVREDILNSISLMEEEGRVAASSGRTHISDKVKEGLLYSEEDVESSRKFVLLCPYDTFANGTVEIHSGDDEPHPDEYTDENIMDFFNIIPGDMPDLGEYQSEDPDDENTYTVIPGGSTLIISYTSYIILKQAAPRLRPYMIFTLAGVREGTRGAIEGVDYGFVARSIDWQYVSWRKICELDPEVYKDGEAFNDPAFWKNLLMQEDKTDEEILDEAWRGPGNMWVFVRPDRFPLAQTFAAGELPNYPVPEDITNANFGVHSAPADVLIVICEYSPVRSTVALMGTCKKLRALILPHARNIARRQLEDYEPWYIPAGPFGEDDDDPWGREEVDLWEEECAEGGLQPEDMKVKFPWLVYRLECSKSMSMWNRKRIWHISKQLEGLAVQKGLLEI